MSHNHSHHVFGSSFKLFFVLIFNLIITVVEFLGGLFSNSLALLSDSFHNFTDTVAIALTFLGIKVSQKDKDKKKTYGYKRAQIIIAFVNSLVLILVCLYLLYEGIYKIISPTEVKSSLMLIIAIIGFVANLLSVLLLREESSSSLNIRSSYLHLFSDTLSSVGVIIGALVMKFFNIYFVDGLVTIMISLYIIYETFSIFKKSIDIFMQGSSLDYSKIRDRIILINGIKNIHHMHSWMLDENTLHFEAHVKLDDLKLSDVHKIYQEIEEILENEFSVSHITIQPEFIGCTDNICGE